jgi:hypothetical protein
VPASLPALLHEVLNAGGSLKTPISISAIVVFPRKSSRFNYFLDRPTWLPLAQETPF